MCFKAGNEVMFWQWHTHTERIGVRSPSLMLYPITAGRMPREGEGKWESHTHITAHLPDLITSLLHNQRWHSIITERNSRCVHSQYFTALRRNLCVFKRVWEREWGGNLYNLQTVQSRSDCQWPEEVSIHLCATHTHTYIHIYIKYLIHFCHL